MSVATYFHKRAAEFDSLYEREFGLSAAMNRWLRAGLYERAEMAAREIGTIPGASVLDVGCGSGRNCALFADAGAKRLVGIDVAENMIAMARKQNGARRASPLAQTKFICADFMQFDFAEKFDAAVALGVFDYIADPVPFLERMKSVAKRKVIASFPGRSLFRAPLRKLRYAVRGCPVYFYREVKLENILARSGMPQAKIIPYASSGFMAIAELTPE